MTETQDFRVRAYMVRSTAAYMGEKLGEQVVARMVQGLSPEARGAVTDLKPADWCSVSAYAELLRALAAESKGNSDQARDTLIACGEYVAREATNTFLKVLMKMLTPGLFAKKLPSIWRRDCSGGNFEVDVTDTKLICKLSDIKGFDHVPCTAAGFVRFGLTGMGKTIEKVEIHNWSLSNPCAEGACIEFTWKV
jgi:hypothetical protein